jgi:hypothetical protein
MSEATAGTLVGYLRLDASQWHEELRRAGIAAEALDEKSPDIDIDVNAEEAVARLRAVGEEADRTGKSIEKASKDAKAKGINPLAAAIGILGPAIAPIGAAAVGLGAGFGAMGAAGVLAIMGIKREMEEGTSLGLRYKSALDDAKGVLDGITHSGAEAFFGSLTQIIATLKSHTGALTPLLSEMTTYLGQSATNLVDAALTAFETFRPVIREVAAYVVDLTRRLNDGAQGDGFKSFVDYVAGVLPSVISTVESLVMAVGNIAAAASPLGGVVLDALNGIASAINAIDPTILQVVAVAAGSAYTAFVAYRALSFIPSFFTSTGTSAAAAGAGMETASRGARALQASMGIISIAIGAATAVYSAFASRNQEVATATANYTDALIQSNGAINENVRLVALKKAQDDGALDRAKMLGLTTNDVVDAYLGQADALGKIEPAYDAAAKAQLAKVNAGQADASTMSDLLVAYLEFKNNVGDSGEALKGAKVAQQQHNEVVRAGATAQGDYAGKVYTATDYIEEQKTALEAWKTAADAAITQTLSLEGAHDAATQRLKEANKAVRESNGNLKGNSDKALQARESVRSYAEAKLREASEVQKATGSNVKANGVIEAGRKALYDSMRQAGLTKAEAQRLIDKYLQIPKSIKTNVDLASETAQRRAQLLKDTMAAIRSKTITITVKQRLQNTVKLGQNLQNPDDAYANGGIAAYANGGIHAFANGSENHVAQIAPAGAMRLWAEPETGGEAYIPLHPAKRDRSLAIWEETGKRLGALGQGGGSDNSEAIASALLALAGELRSLHSIPGAVERGLAQNARLARLDARARI